LASFPVVNHYLADLLNATYFLTGKSTQVPQFLLDANPDCYICVTQPRRIAAISIADRVAAEQADGTLIAHQVRLENNVTADTQLVFCTPGVLLRKLQSSPRLNEYTHIILDEVHERDRYQEFLLIILRDLLPSRPDLRLVLMSATLQTVDIFQYFANLNPATVAMEGRTFPVQEFFLEDALSMTGFVDGVATALETGDDPNNIGNDVKIQCVLCGKSGFKTAEALGEHIAFCDGTLHNSDGEDSVQNDEAPGADTDEDYRLDDIVFDDYDVNLVADNGTDRAAFALNGDASEGGDETPSGAEKKWDGLSDFDLSRPSEEPVGRAEELLKQYQGMHDDETVDNFLVLELMRHIIQRGDGGILVFLPGWQEISELSSILESTMPFSNRSQFCILSLHSGIHSSEQRRVLQRPPHGVRKVVLATNIAETSLTIDDIVFVIDSGRAKEKNYDPHLKTSTLQTTWISQASAKQRKGRAGRVRSGVCFHLFSKLRHEALRPFTESELLRTPLVRFCFM
jgi:ATP-dependent RNA helicase DHX36